MLDKASEKLIEIIEKAGFQAYAVGGCVRDAIMGRKTNDYDITTSAMPLETEQILEKNGIRFVETGLKHGTITAVIDGTPYEITTFRTEFGYSDNRHPDSVEFVTELSDDLSRRDFTINAMAYNNRCGIVDLFGGRQDIENKLIRTVGEPDKRFGEDALRILRALRFSSCLGFELHPDTALSISRNYKKVMGIANERITAEVVKMVGGELFAKHFCNYPLLFADVFGLDCQKLEKHALCEIYDFISNAPKDIVFILAFLDKYKNDKKFEKHAPFGRLILPSDMVKRATLLIENLETDIPFDETELTLLLSQKGDKLLFDIAEYKGNKKAKLMIGDIIGSGRPYLVSHLAITGNDVIELGISGKEIGNTLSQCLKAVIKGQIQNNKQSIIKYIKNTVL